MNRRTDKGWWGRNWKWSVPVGCLGLLGLFAAFVVLLVGLVFGLMKSSDAYKGALARAAADPAVQEAIGTPVEAGLFVTGNINVSGSTGQADLAIPIRGPDGRGTIHVVAAKAAGQWQFSTLVVEINGSDLRLNLLE